MMGRGGGIPREIGIHSFAMSFLDTSFISPLVFGWENTYVGLG